MTPPSSLGSCATSASKYVGLFTLFLGYLFHVCVLACLAPAVCAVVMTLHQVASTLTAAILDVQHCRQLRNLAGASCGHAAVQLAGALLP